MGVKLSELPPVDYSKVDPLYTGHQAINELAKIVKYGRDNPTGDQSVFVLADVIYSIMRQYDL